MKRVALFAPMHEGQLGADLMKESKAASILVAPLDLEEQLGAWLVRLTLHGLAPEWLVRRRVQQAIADVHLGEVDLVLVLGGALMSGSSVGWSLSAR